MSEEQVREVKNCQRGPLFHFRVSKTGTRLLATVATRAHEGRACLVFARKWALFVEEVDHKFGGMNFEATAAALDNVKQLLRL